MVNFMLSTVNEREKQILQMAFTQRGITVHPFVPSYKCYVKMLQYLPDLIIIELPHVYMEQLHFIKLLKKHKKLKSILTMGYGNPLDKSLKKGIINHGVHIYFERPLKFSELLQWIKPRMEAKNKTINGPVEKNDKCEDTKMLLSTDTLSSKKVEVMVKYVSNLLAFPFTVAKVLKLTQDSKSGAGDLAKVIEADPVITSDILKISNTVFFASANRTINSIKDAIVRIGFNETKRIVMSMSVMDIVGKENKNFGFDRIDFWYHSLATAIISERIAKQMGTVNPENVFLAGLLHDFGILILDNFFSDIFANILEKTTDESAHFIDKEVAILGINHNDVVKELFEKWKMPSDISEGILRQYDFQKLKEDLKTNGKKLAFCVGIANILAKVVYLGRECDQFIQPIDNSVFLTIKLPTGFNENFLEDIYHDINLYRQFLKLEEREFTIQREGLDDAEEHKIGIVNLAKDIFLPPLLYLSKEGIEIETISPEIKSSELDSRFNLILIWAGEQTRPDDINKYTQIIKYFKEPPQPEEKTEFAPLLVCIRDDSTLYSDKSLKKISFMGQHFDLRKLEQNISEINMGKFVEFIPYVEDTKETIETSDAATRETSGTE